MNAEREQNLEKEANSSKHLVIVFWNPEDSVRAATSLYLVEESIEFDELIKARGMAISEFFDSQGYTIQWVMEEFPDFVVPSNPNSPRLSWKLSLDVQGLPKDKLGLQKLSNFLGMRLETYIFDKARGEKPRPHIKVEPEKWKS